MVMVLADTSKVHAGETRVRKLSAITTSPPPTGVRTSGATTTSSGEQGPLGWASGVGVGFGGLDLRGFLVPFGIWISGPLDVTDGSRAWRRPARRRGPTGPSRSRRSTRRAAGRPRRPAATAVPSTATPSHPVHARRHPPGSALLVTGLGHAGNANQHAGPRRVATPARLRSPTMNDLHAPLLEWYDAHARDLPWRGEHATPWSVMVSEFMLQQTPVARVEPVHRAVAGDLADPRRPRRRAERRGRPRLGPARLPAPGPAPARRGHRDRRAVRRPRCRRRTTTCARCPASATTRPPPSRRSASAGGTPSSTPTCGACSPGSSAASSCRLSPRPRPRSGWPRACCPTTRPTPRPGRSP